MCTIICVHDVRMYINVTGFEKMWPDLRKAVAGVAGMCVSFSSLFPRTHISMDAYFPVHISLMQYVLQVCHSETCLPGYFVSPPQLAHRFTYIQCRWLITDLCMMWLASFNWFHLITRGHQLQQNLAVLSYTSSRLHWSARLCLKF